MNLLKQNRKKLKTIFLLHIMLALYSVGGIFSKLVSTQKFPSKNFFLLYGLVLLNLAVYAICWQQILKKIPLFVAYANKAVTIIWGMLWGKIFFNEKITLIKVIGASVIIIGIYYVLSGENEI